MALLFALQSLGAGCSGDEAKYPELKGWNGIVTVDLSGIGAGSGRFQSYRSRSGKMVDFLVYRDSGGVPHAVLDACRTCYRWRKGYLLERSEVVCLKCGLRFKLDDLAQGIGACVPIRLAAEAKDGALVLAGAELEAGSRFF